MTIHSAESSPASESLTPEAISAKVSNFPALPLTPVPQPVPGYGIKPEQVALSPVNGVLPGIGSISETETSFTANLEGGVTLEMGRCSVPKNGETASISYIRFRGTLTPEQALAVRRMYGPGGDSVQHLHEGDTIDAAFLVSEPQDPEIPSVLDPRDMRAAIRVSGTGREQTVECTPAPTEDLAFRAALINEVSAVLGSVMLSVNKMRVPETVSSAQIPLADTARNLARRMGVKRIKPVLSPMAQWQNDRDYVHRRLQQGRIQIERMQQETRKLVQTAGIDPSNPWAPYEKNPVDTSRWERYMQDLAGRFGDRARI
jgi:hypothetical protein